MSKAHHETLGSKDSKGKFKLDSATTIAITKSYLSKLEDGSHSLKGISEIDLGNGLFARTFVIQE